MATAAASASTYCCNTLLHLPRLTHFRRISPPLTHRPELSFVTRRAAAVESGNARFGPRARASSGPPPPPPPVFETVEEEKEEEEERGWSDAEAEFSDEVEDEQEWAGGNGVARREDLGADAGEDLSGWTRQWPRPRELFVCNLPRRCDVEDLLVLFGPHGTVLSVEVSRDAETGISRGTAFITMRSLAEARTAINALDGFDLDGREIFVKLASDVISNRKNVNLTHITPTKDHIFESPHKIYVGNLAWSVQPQDLRELFTQCGTVVSTRLLTDRKGGRNRVYGFLSFSSAEELEAALKLDKTVFFGRDIVVKEAHVERQSA
ncbi:28 kDa ribonucleoprotein, chloroplastic-like [Panicum virgatum]|nr:28 kDa ribonucleoprotein, chloroplastic-like [Panicum virgatum]